MWWRRQAWGLPGSCQGCWWDEEEGGKEAGRAGRQGAGPRDCTQPATALKDLSRAKDLSSVHRACATYWRDPQLGTGPGRMPAKSKPTLPGGDTRLPLTTARGRDTRGEEVCRPGGVPGQRRLDVSGAGGAAGTQVVRAMEGMQTGGMGVGAEVGGSCSMGIDCVLTLSGCWTSAWVPG